VTGFDDDDYDDDDDDGDDYDDNYSLLATGDTGCEVGKMQYFYDCCCCVLYLYLLVSD